MNSAVDLKRELRILITLFCFFVLGSMFPQMCPLFSKELNHQQTWMEQNQIGDMKNPCRRGHFDMCKPEK